MAFELRGRRRLLARTFFIASLSCGAGLVGCGSDATETPGELLDDTGTTDETGSDTSSGDTGTPDDTGTVDDTGTRDTATVGDTGRSDGGGDTRQDGTVATDSASTDSASTDSASTDSASTDSASTDSASTDSATDTSTADVGPPTITITAPAVVTEGNAGTTVATFTVTLSQASSTEVTVAYATADGTATTAGGDYQSLSGTLTFAPGTTTQTIPVLVNGDTLDELDEAFSVTLTSPTGGATLATATAQATITDDDAAPTISISDETNTEGNTGNKAFTFTVTLSAASGQEVKVDYATAAGTATQGTDYARAAGTLTFAPGTTSQTVTVDVTGDITIEPDETFTVGLTNPVNGTIAKASGAGTIVNDDVATGTPTLSIDDVAITEGDTGTKTLTFTVTRAGNTAGASTVSWSTSDVTAIAAGAAAVGGQDYVSQVNQTLSFAAGETSKTISVTINGDALVEPNETFEVTLSNATGATVTKAIGVGTITNDDALPTLSIADFTTTEGNAGLKAFTFTVTLSKPAGQNVTVKYNTQDGTATSGAGAGVDYIAIASPLTLTFTPGETTKTVTVQVIGNTTVEANETFKVLLTAPTNATIADGEAIGTITNDD